MLKSLPYSQLLRVKRIVEDPERIPMRLNQMCNKFQRRGYPYTLIESQRNKVDEIDRSTLLMQKEVKTKNKRLTFVSTYNTLSTQINNIIKREWRILGDTLPSIPEFRNPPRMAFKRARNLKDNLCRADIGPEKKPTQMTFKPLRKRKLPLPKMQ